jgi:hypothetical protein
MVNPRETERNTRRGGKDEMPTLKLEAQRREG